MFDAAQPDAPAPSPASRLFEIDTPVLLGDTFIGEVPARVSMDGDAQFPLEALIALLAPRLRKGALDAAPRDMDFITDEGLRAAGLNAEYDPGELALRILVAPTDRAAQTLNITGRGMPDPTLADPPAEFAAGLSAILRPEYQFSGDSGLQPLRGELRGFATLGGFDGWSVLGRAFFEAGGGGGGGDWRIDEASLLKDAFRSAIRFQLGAVRPQTSTFQTQRQVLGLSVERNYRAIQPFRTLRSTGRRTFILERPARVTFEVNGVAIESQQLPEGQFDVDNFPLLIGSNNVRVLIEDELGRRELADFSVFSNIELLGEGLTLFGVSAGMPRNRSGVFAFENAIRASGHVAHGVSSGLTLGGYFDAGEEGALVAAQSAVAIGAGVASGEVAYVSQDGRSGFAGIAGYRINAFEALDAQHSVALQAEYRSRGFANFGGAPQQDKSYRATLDYQGRRGQSNIGVSVSHEVTQSVRTTTVNATYSRNFGPVSAGLSARPRFSSRDGSDVIVTFNLSRRFGPRISARARTEATGKRAGLEFDRFSVNSIGEWGARAAINRNEGVVDSFGTVNYVGSRFEAELAHRFREADGGAQTRNALQARFGFGLGVADGQVGFGRPFDNGFVVVDAHKSLNKYEVALTDRSGERVLAKNGRFVPTLAPVRASYSPRRLFVRADDAPTGYDLGNGELDIFPGARSGYILKIGSAASISALGVFETKSGQRLSLVIGDLVSLDDPDAERVQFFTNRTGRFAAENLSPGRYQVVIQPQGEVIGELEIEESEDFIDDVGVVIVEDIAL